MAIALQSPGVAVDIIDESNYVPSGPGTIPLIVIATQQDKTNPSGQVAPYSTAATAGKLQLVSSQKELINNYGTPFFSKDSSGNVIYGSETSEYGLLAAHSALGLINSAYVIRANIDLGSLTSQTIRPKGNPMDGTVWLDTTNTRWGIFEWDSANQVFNQITPRIITSTSDIYNGRPKSSIGNVGDYAVDCTTTNNYIYRKNYINSWALVGSSTWKTTVPTVISNNSNVGNLTAGNSITINTVTVTLTGATATTLATAINNQNITGVTAACDSTTGYRLFIFAADTATSNGSTADGKIVIANNSGTPLTALGITAGSYANPALQFSPHSSIPNWHSIDATPRPTGSVWMKTSNVNYGANFALYKWNGNTLHWDPQAAPVYQNDQTAIYNIDPTQGGLAITANTHYVQYDVDVANTASFRIWTRADVGPLSVTGTVANPTFTANSTFTIRSTVAGSSSLSTIQTITIVADQASALGANAFVQSLLSANVPNIRASVSSTGNVVITHALGGVIDLVDGTNTPLATAGITVNNDYARDASPLNNDILISWYEGQPYNAQATGPISQPNDGTLWYYGTPLEADIMINTGGSWRGYRTVSSDIRGYNLVNTDTNGPIFSPSAPTTQSTGGSIVYGDLWINTSTLENYPQIYRWQRLGGVDQWVQVTADPTVQSGVLFADARWDTTGITDPALDALTPISSMLLSNYVDIDAPDPTLYPRGSLLFNTRRSSYNVKKYVAQHFTSANFPMTSLPAQAATWTSASGKRDNGVPFFGRRAVRSAVVAALRAAVDGSTELREDQRNFNLLVAPGYPELITNLVNLNGDRRYTGFVLGDTPMGLAGDSSTVENYILNSNGASSDNEDGLVSTDPYSAVFYPGAVKTNDLTGATVVAPITHAILHTVISSDQKSHPWFAPAGQLRGNVTNATAIGFVNRDTGAFTPIGTNQGLRDLLYKHNVNPVAVFPGVGILNYGNKTRQLAATSLDRINVARLSAYLRYQLEIITKPLVFEPNDTITRNEAKAIVSALLNDLVTQRGVYDYLVVCDDSNNTPSTIDANELHIDIAIEPTKSVEFIYIPVRLKNTGEIKSGNISPAQAIA
jgi:Phage tail sheath C-terminal domain